MEVASLSAKVTVDVGNATRGLSTLRTRLIQSTGWFKSLRDQANITGTSLKSGLISGIDTAKKGLAGLGESFDATKALIGSALLAPMALVGKTAIDAVASYEKEMNVFQLVTRASTSDMEAASAAIKELANDTALAQFSKNEMAAALLAIAQTGRSAADSVSMLRPGLLLAAAGEVDAATGATILAEAMNTFKLPASEAARVADVLAGAMKYGGIQLQQLSESLQIVGPVAKQAGIPIQDTSTLLAELGRAGIKGSEAGTQLRNVIQGLITPSGDAKAMLQAMGVHVYDATGAMRPFRDIIADLAVGLGPLTEAQKNQRLQTIFGTDAMGAASIIFGKDGVKAFDDLKQEVTQAGLAQEIADAKTKGLEGSTKALNAAAQNAAFDAIDPFKDSIKGLADAATGLLRGFSNLDPSVKTLIGGALIFATAAAGLGVAIQVLTFAAGGLAVALGAVELVLGVVLSPIGLVVLAVAALAAGLIYAYNHSETFKNLVDGAFKAVAEGAQWMWGIVEPILRPLGDLLSGILKNIGLLPSALPATSPALPSYGPAAPVVAAPARGPSPRPGERVVAGPNFSGQYQYQMQDQFGVHTEWRDQGGPGFAGRQYAIGVPELFVPNTGGNFVPLGGAQVSGGNTVVFYGPVYGFQDFEDHVKLAMKNIDQKSP